MPPSLRPGRCGSGGMRRAVGGVALRPRTARAGTCRARGWHALVGIGEGLITAGLVSRSSPGASRRARDAGRPTPERAGRHRAHACWRSQPWAFLARVLAPRRARVRRGDLGFRGRRGGNRVCAPRRLRRSRASQNDALAGVLAGIVGIAITGRRSDWRRHTSAARRRRDAAHQAELHRHEPRASREPAHGTPTTTPTDGHEHGTPALGFERFTYVVSPSMRSTRERRSSPRAVRTGCRAEPPLRPARARARGRAACSELDARSLACLSARSSVAARGCLLPAADDSLLFAPFTNGRVALGLGDRDEGLAVGDCACCFCRRPRPCRGSSRASQALGMPVVFVETLTFLYRFVAVLRRPGRLDAPSDRQPRLRAEPVGARQALRQPRGQPVRAHVRARRACPRRMLSRGYRRSCRLPSDSSCTAADAILVVLAAVAAAAIVLY